MTKKKNDSALVQQQIAEGTLEGGKHYGFDEAHDPGRPAEMWFQRSEEGEILFVVFYAQACRWSRCLGCNLPSKMSEKHVDFKALMDQIDHVLVDPEVQRRRSALNKVIVSNNGSVLDEATFSSTALVYLIAQINRHLPNLAVLSLETRAEYVDVPELEFIARALAEGDTPTALELAIGFEAFDDRIRNHVFRKGLHLRTVERLCEMLANHGFHLKCYFMQKPVPGMTDEAAVDDIRAAIDYLGDLARAHGLPINLHLNPTYVARGTPLEESFLAGEYRPPRLFDVARAALHGEGKGVSIYLGLSDEGLACDGGGFIRRGEEALVELLETFNQTQRFEYLQQVVDTAVPAGRSA